MALLSYAGGHKSGSDVAELRARDPEADPGKLREVCAGARRSRRLEAVLKLD